MDEGASEVHADAAAVARSRKSDAATAAAAAACVQLAAAATGPYSKMHSSDQVLLLEAHELWDTIAENWCKPGAESISQIVETWEGRDLAACVYKLGLPVLYAKRNYVQHMRRSVVDAVRAYAKAHPELFDAPASSAEEQDAGAEVSSPEHEVGPPALAAAVSPSHRVIAPAAPAAAAVDSNRRSPRSPASSRSVAAMAFAALQALPGNRGSAQAELAPSDSRRRREPSSGAGVPMSPPRAVNAVRGSKSSRPSLPLQDVGAGESDPDDDDNDGSDEDDDDDGDSEWSPNRDDPIAGTIRRGGQLRREDMDHQLAAAGVQRSFHEGFVRNARFAAGGRSMYQLYKEVTSAFSHESSRRECLALSRILDALLRGDKSAALEHTCRRLGGVHTAAETGNWAMCERLETEAEQRSFVPDAFMRSALKSVTQMQAVKKSVSNGATGKGGASNKAATGRWEQRGSTARSNKKEFNKDTQPGASASYKKKSGSDTK